MHEPIALSNPSNDQHPQFMLLALEQGQLALDLGEVPVGAVVVKDGQIIGKGFNRPVGSHDPSAHAEIMALREAGQWLNNYRLPGCQVYVTLEPCTMCVGAMIHARIDRLVYAAREPKSGVICSNLNILQQPFYNHTMQVKGGVLADQASQMLSNFFKQRRENHKHQKAH